MIIECKVSIYNLQQCLINQFLEKEISRDLKIGAILEVSRLQTSLKMSHQKYIFGFFITLKRGCRDTRLTFPRIKDIQHACVQGCMGHWNLDFTQYQRIGLLVSKMFSMVNTIKNEDSRYGHYRERPIKGDYQANVSITFMLAPKYLIDNLTGWVNKSGNLEEFNNRDYGIISQFDKQRATYLPNVFPKEDFLEIKKNLLQKAGISNSRQAKIHFYAYDCCIYDCLLNQRIPNIQSTLVNSNRKKVLKQSLKKKKNHLSLFNDFISFINKYYGEMVPYLVNSNFEIIVDSNQDVRNLATIYDILQVSTITRTLESDIYTKLENNLDFYSCRYLENPDSMRQSSSFLMLALNTLDPIKNKVMIEIISSRLLSKLEYTDREFELGECLIALTRVKSVPKETLIYYQQQMMSTNSNHELNDIFRINWDSKLIYALWKENLRTNSELQQHALSLFNQVSRKLETILRESMETNYWAVTFECLCSLRPFLRKQEKEIDELLKKLLEFLNKRKNKQSLFKFTSGEARVDITGHILNGYKCLYQSLK